MAREDVLPETATGGNTKLGYESIKSFARRLKEVEKWRKSHEKAWIIDSAGRKLLEQSYFCTLQSGLSPEKILNKHRGALWRKPGKVLPVLPWRVFWRKLEIKKYREGGKSTINVQLCWPGWSRAYACCWTSTVLAQTQVPFWTRSNKQDLKSCGSPAPEAEGTGPFSLPCAQHIKIAWLVLKSYHYSGFFAPNEFCSTACHFLKSFIRQVMGRVQSALTVHFEPSPEGASERFESSAARESREGGGEGGREAGHAAGSTVFTFPALC